MDNLILNPDEETDKCCLFPDIEDAVASILTPVDLEAHPFLIGWYNELVGPKFAIDLPANTVALVLISGPEVFEKCVIPFLKTQVYKSSTFSTTDPLDESMKYLLSLFSGKLEMMGYDTDVFHDFDLFPNRRPKVLVQTAAHCAGAAEYFLKSRLKPENIPIKKLFGVAVHPKFGGWFAIRGIVVFKNVQKDLMPAQPLNLLTDEDRVRFLLEQFTYNWKDNLWRDVIPSKEGKKYSTDFLEYLETHPDERWQFIESKGYLAQES